MPVSESQNGKPERRSGETARRDCEQGNENAIKDTADPHLRGGGEIADLSVGKKKAKMAPQPSAPPGLEQDSHGNAIPFEQRTPEDRILARAGRK